MNALAKNYGPKGLVVIGINNEENKDDVAKFARSKESVFPILRGMDSVLESYGVTGFPTNYFIDKQGKVHSREVGFGEESEKKFAETIESLLGSK
ncbi:MAG: TlpA family protein disulfide reductase [Planctomycetes bacterium]|nr:TlpA family protein disulfide reductase [Planctomycetota bacterium]MBI3845623.1 TlpA family protein disulfide reductase [Planctomycetota bacterium]